jgi:anti-anti-sigma regulatory factor
MEAQWVADRLRLRTLLVTRPDWTRQDLADALGRSLSWVKKWLKRLCDAPADDDTVLHSQSRARRTPPSSLSPLVVDHILTIRDAPPANLGRIPGPKAILYYLQQEATTTLVGHQLPRSTRTIWRILRQHQRILGPPLRTHHPVERPEPLTSWQLDFKDVSSVPADPEGKQQHVVETLDTVDVGTSSLLLVAPDWAVVIELPWKEAYREVIRQVLFSIGITLAMALLAGLAGVLLARRLAVPLVSLTGTASRITCGEMELQAMVGGPREVASLATAFNTMTAQLRQILDKLEQRVSERTVDLQHALDEVEARAREQERLLADNRQQRETIREMSVPVLPITNSTLVMPLVGALDTERLRLLQDQALRAIERARTRTLILDITGVPIVDSQVAQGLIGVVQAARLLGTEVLLVGIRPEVAQTIVGLGLSLSGLRTSNNLQSALSQMNVNQRYA